MVRYCFHLTKVWQFHMTFHSVLHTGLLKYYVAIKMSFFLRFWKCGWQISFLKNISQFLSDILKSWAFFEFCKSLWNIIGQLFVPWLTPQDINENIEEKRKSFFIFENKSFAILDNKSLWNNDCLVLKLCFRLGHAKSESELFHFRKEKLCLFGYQKLILKRHLLEKNRLLLRQLC